MHSPTENTVSSSLANRSALADTLRDYWALAKPEISFVVVIEAAGGFLLGVPDGEAISGMHLLVLLVGTALSAGGVGVLNHYIERGHDAKMKRTRDRPLPAGRVSPTAARWYGLALVAAGVSLLCPLVNPLTGVLAAVTVLLYLLVYTPLKRVTTYNTLVGTVPGALPALGGFAGATGTLGAGGWAFFLTLAAWQMPHFLALAWMYRKDYARAGYRMLPVAEPSGDSTARQMLLFTGLLLVFSTLPVAVGVAGWIYLAGVIPLGLWFLRTAWIFYGKRTGQNARRVLVASIWYVPVLVALILFDKLL